MKQLVIWALLAAIIKLSGLLPFESGDVSALVPVRALTVAVEEGTVVLDGGDCRGRGATWASALADLKQGADGRVFLGTAEQVVFGENAVELLEDVVKSGALRPAAAVCRCAGELPDPEAAADYLESHDPGLTVRDVQGMLLRRQEIALPLLTETEGGLRLEAGR